MQSTKTKQAMQEAAQKVLLKLLNNFYFHYKWQCLSESKRKELLWALALYTDDPYKEIDPNQWFMWQVCV